MIYMFMWDNTNELMVYSCAASAEVFFTQLDLFVNFSFLFKLPSK